MLRLGQLLRGWRWGDGDAKGCGYCCVVVMRRAVVVEEKVDSLGGVGTKPKQFHWSDIRIELSWLCLPWVDCRFLDLRNQS